MARSRNSRRGIRNCRSHNRKGCEYCLHLRRHGLRARADWREAGAVMRGAETRAERGSVLAVGR